MQGIRKIHEDLYWLGVNDRRLAKFENRFPLPHGVSYNAYLLLDEKTVLLDTVDRAVGGQFFENLEAALAGRTLDYVVLHHMEPDHAACLDQLLQRWPNLQVVGNAKTFQLAEAYFSLPSTLQKTVVAEGDTLCFGRHTLRFLMAPMVHWPETMVSYDESTSTLFSGDAFGAFGAMAGLQFQDELNLQETWLDEARRYYCNIVGKYGMQVQALLNKAATLQLAMVCPLHGPVFRGDFDFLLRHYQAWSSYQPESRGLCVCYASMYGHTAQAAEYVAEQIAAAKLPVRVYDISVTDHSYLVAEAFRVSHLLFAAPTYNNGLFPAMAELLRDMQAMAVQQRKVALIGSGSWMPRAAQLMTEQLAEMKQMELLTEAVVFRGAVDATAKAELDALAAAICHSLTN